MKAYLKPWRATNFLSPQRVSKSESPQNVLPVQLQKYCLTTLYSRLSVGGRLDGGQIRRRDLLYSHPHNSGEMNLYVQYVHNTFCYAKSCSRIYIKIYILFAVAYVKSDFSKHFDLV